jgi:hypothetical protein
MTMTRNADKDQPAAGAPYADEVLCANWHPLVLMLAEPLARVQKTAPAGEDVEGLLARHYLAQGT